MERVKEIYILRELRNAEVSSALCPSGIHSYPCS